ncbi:hypothetical protein [Streptomyces flavalbus]|uniref:C2H2-type domain-containing protein n=1 Tax=Streptomyces flavalbus TaxID=2665155 RepID=A0ABW2W3Q6_9ACTN
MNCPHCQAALLRRERTGSVCSKCGRPFALDPRLHGRGMHDTRVRRIAEKATDAGRRKITLTQLGYLVRTSNPTWAASPESGRPPWIGRSVAAVLVVALVVLGVLVRDSPHALLIWWAGAGVAAVGYAVARGKRYQPARRAGGHVVPSPEHFRTIMRGRWTQVYEGLPPGVVDDLAYREPRDGGGPTRRSTASVALLCPDPAVRVFLSANDVPRRLNLRLAAERSDLPGDGPVVVLHDASARGYQLVADVRADRPGQVVVDAGLPVRAALLNAHAVTLYEEPPARLRSEPSEWPDWLRRMAVLAPAEAEWLTQGRTSPLAAVPPALLESAVERAVAEARAARDPERRKAAAVGFMSWPRTGGE